MRTIKAPKPKSMKMPSSAPSKSLQAGQKVLGAYAHHAPTTREPMPHMAEPHGPMWPHGGGPKN